MIQCIMGDNTILQLIISFCFQQTFKEDGVAVSNFKFDIQEQTKNISPNIPQHVHLNSFPPSPRW